MNDPQPIPKVAFGFVLLLLLPPVLAGVDISLGPNVAYTLRLTLWNEPWLYAAGLALFLALVDMRQTRKKWVALGRTEVLVIGLLIVQSLILSRTVAADYASADLHLMRALFALALGVAAYYGMAAYGQRFALPVYGALIAGAVLSALAVLVFLYASPESRVLGEGLKWRVPGFGPVRIFGITQEVGIAVATVLLASPRKPRFSWLLWGALVLMWAALFWSGGRGAVLSLVVSMGVVSVLVRARFWALWRGVAIGAALGAGLSLLVWAPEGEVFAIKTMIQNTAQSGVNNVSHGRLERWGQTFEMALQRPLFGHGLNQFSNLWQPYQMLDQSAGTNGPMPFYFLSYRNAHNIVLEALLAWGIIGGALFFWLGAKGWLTTATRAYRLGNNAQVAAFAALTALVVHALFTGVYIFPSGLMYLGLFFGISLAPISAQNKNTSA